jgi:tyrosinase
MAAVRRNILINAQDRDRFIDGCLALKNQPTGLTTQQLGLGPGPLAASRPLSLWDLFVIWHMWSMQQISIDGARNAAHMGPVFLPWHRWYLLQLERQMQILLGLGQDDFGLPYWDWAADGTNLTQAQQRTTAEIWTHIGGNGQGPVGEVTDGPFTFANFPLNVEQGPGGQMRVTNRGLRRRFGVSTPLLPREDDVNAALADSVYDQPNWDASSMGFRNLAEGWVPSQNAPMTHNRVHVWVGGDMAPGTSPNDPVFFLNHCNEDRIWALWQQAHPGSTYQPQGQSPSQNDPLFRHRSLDPLYSIFTQGEPQIASMFDVSAFYVYE